MALEDFLTGAENVAGWPLFLVNALLSMRSGGLQNMLAQRAQLAGTPGGQAMLSGHPFLAGMAGYGTTSAPSATTLPPGGGVLAAPQPAMAPTARHVDLPPLPPDKALEQDMMTRAQIAWNRINARTMSGEPQEYADYQTVRAAGFNIPIPEDVVRAYAQSLIAKDPNARVTENLTAGTVSERLDAGGGAGVKIINGIPHQYNPQTKTWEPQQVSDIRMPGARGGGFIAPSAPMAASPTAPAPGRRGGTMAGPSAPATAEPPSELGPKTTRSSTTHVDKFGNVTGGSTTHTGDAPILTHDRAKSIIAEAKAGKPTNPMDYKAAKGRLAMDKAEKTVKPGEMGPGAQTEFKRFFYEHPAATTQDWEDFRLGNAAKAQVMKLGMSKLSAADKKTLDQIDNARFLFGRLRTLIENDPDVAAGRGLIEGRIEQYLYQAGIAQPGEDPYLAAQNLLSIVGVAPWLSGMRRYEFVKDVRAHLPKAGDQLELINSKINNFEMFGIEAEAKTWQHAMETLSSGPAQLQSLQQQGAAFGLPPSDFAVPAGTPFQAPSTTSTTMPKVMSGSWGQGQANAP